MLVFTPIFALIGCSSTKQRKKKESFLFNCLFVLWKLKLRIVEIEITIRKTARVTVPQENTR